MIAYGPGGPADFEHMNEWRIACDRCGKKTPWADTDTWFVGESTDCRVYCPRCARRIARRLLRSALWPRPRLLIKAWLQGDVRPSFWKTFLIFMVVGALILLPALVGQS